MATTYSQEVITPVDNEDTMQPLTDFIEGLKEREKIKRNDERFLSQTTSQGSGILSLMNKLIEANR